MFVKISKKNFDGRKKTGRFVSFSVRTDGKKVALIVCVSHEVLREVGWENRDAVVVAVGADIHCGILEVERDCGGRRLMMPTEKSAYSEIRLPMGSVWALPVLPRRAQEDVKFDVVGERLVVRLPGDFTRLLRAGQEKLMPRKSSAA